MSYGISQKNAIKEFQLKEDVLENAMKDGQLKFHWKSCHGNTYRSLIYRDVVEFAKVAEKDPVLVDQYEKRKHRELLAKYRKELGDVTTELDNIDNRKEYLMKRKQELKDLLKDQKVSKKKRSNEK